MKKPTLNQISTLLLTATFFLLPFERIPTFEMLGFTVKLSYVAFLLFLVLFLPRLPSLFRENKLSTSDRFLLLFWLSGLISLLFTPNPKRSIITLALWAFVFAFYFVFSRLLKNEQLRKKVENIIIISSILVSIFGIYQFVGDSIGLSTTLTGLRIQYTKIVLGFPRIQSVALEPLYFSNFLLVPFFIALKRYIFEKKILNQYLWVISLISINIILGISRGAYLSIIIALAIALLFFIISGRKSISDFNKKLFDLIVAIILSLVISFVLIISLNGKKASGDFINHSNVQNEISAGGRSSTSDRLGSYQKAFDLFKQKPIFGNGIASFGPLTVGSEQDFKQFGYGIVNNEYLEILSETGIVGLITFVLFLLFRIREVTLVFKRGDDSKKKIGMLLISFGCVAIFIQYNFFSTLYIIYIWAFLALLRGYELDLNSSKKGGL